jgi:uncharacterized membrane protein
VGEGEGREEESRLILIGIICPHSRKSWGLVVSRIVKEVDSNQLANPLGHQWNCGNAHQEKN